MRKKLHFLFLNIGHFLDHLFMLVFATVAALALTREWQLSYSELIFYAMPGFIAFGAFALPAGWLADKWSRHGMLVIFFIGIGAASIATALAQTPLQIGIGLFAIGVFAAIYHPVGIALVLEGRKRVGMAIAVNGVYGNMGVAAAAAQQPAAATDVEQPQTVQGIGAFYVTAEIAAKLVLDIGDA